MFWNRKRKVEQKVETEVDKIVKALKIFEGVGLTVKDIYCSKEFIKAARDNRKSIDKVGCNAGLLSMDTRFACWLDKKTKHVFNKKAMKIKGKDFEGMMFGINFRSKK